VPLTDTFVRQLKPTATAQKHFDGGGLHLLVKSPGKYWRLDYRFNGRRKTLALGVYPAVSLAKARSRRDEAKVLLADGKDPGVEKRDAREAQLQAARNTFEAVATAWLEKTAKTRKAITQQKVSRWLEKDIVPYIGSMPIASLTPRDVLIKVARRMEARGVHEGAHRITQICGRIFRYAVAEGIADRDVTADLKGALAAVPRSNFAAITDPKKVGELLRSIHAYTGHPATLAALKLAPLVFVRPGVLRKAEWAELDLDAAEWRVPASKMKMKIEHLVPLSRHAVEILREQHALTGHGRYVFPSIRTRERPMSENTLNAALRGMGYDQNTMTAHGFRAMARTIMDEVLQERVDLIEHQLAHQVKDANGRAYNRTTHLPQRREMMQRWGDFLDTLRMGAQVIPLKAVA
jgi:integrase